METKDSSEVWENRAKTWKDRVQRNNKKGQMEICHENLKKNVKRQDMLKKSWV